MVRMRFSMSLVAVLMALCYGLASAEIDDKAMLPPEVLEGLNAMDGALGTFEEEMAKTNSTGLDSPTTAVAEATQNSRAVEIFMTCLKYLRAFYYAVLYIYRYLMFKLLGNKLIVSLESCRHEEKFLATPLVDATTGCGAKYLIGDEHIVLKLVENQRNFCKYIKTLPTDFMKCKKQSSRAIAIACYIKLAIEVTFKSSIAIIIFTTDMTSLTTTASLHQLSSWSAFATTGQSLRENVRECIRPQVRTLNDKCKEHKLKEAERKHRIQEVDFEHDDLDTLVRKHLPEELTKYKNLTNIDDELMKKLNGLLDDIPFIDEDE